MIIFFNSLLVLLFIVQSCFKKHEYEFFKNIVLKLKKKINNFFIKFTNSGNYSFKKVLDFWPLYLDRSKWNKKMSFKNFFYISYLLNKFKSEWVLWKLFLSTDFIIEEGRSYRYIKSKLNSFLKKNPYKKFEEVVNFVKSIYKIKCQPSSFVKYYYQNKLNVMFLRKNKIFNKGRYSRNRQLYRTGVYWCIWLSVFLGYCLYFSFYRFTFNFGYMWWLVFFFMFLFVNQKMFKYNLYNLKVIRWELKKNFDWISLFFKNLLFFFKNILSR